jgi:hypothetical protein
MQPSAFLARSVSSFKEMFKQAYRVPMLLSHSDYLLKYDLQLKKSKLNKLSGHVVCKHLQTEATPRPAQIKE